jgi:hypothetical protein
MIHELTIPIYSNKIIFVDNPEEYENIQSEKGVPESELSLDHYRGITNNYHNDELQLEILVGVFDGTNRTLVHELGHAAIIICEDKGFTPQDGNGEPFLYLLDYMVDYFENVMKKSK